ncbi:RagB/SusD family nutrient uptake outer membrane protein [Hallella seregens]|uniref:RagB/SusD family nutrient uptake outer membrane protein n=1 Tax=Hallella seregens ATCC 51272 TaxID=1336250 RepID=A0ABV5ZGD4_9BACT|nr:RagB/SusD family nutrient uptake outer membrane protein [Hallella seregens]
MMKQHKIIFLLFSLMLATPMLTSCDSFFDIKPQSELVGEDFWQSKSDVESSVAACYRALQEPDAMERFIVWGEVRSDNVIHGTNTNENINNILNANVDATNSYTSWGCIYTVINYCNTVIANAPSVMERDPNFKQSELRAFLTEAKSIRALCYFYLVRTFKDVPFITEPYVGTSRPFQTAQTSETEILDSLTKELEDIAWQAKAVYASTSNTKGHITQKAVWTLLADMYLWINQYDKCIEACNKVLNSTTNPLQLETASAYNQNVFGKGNSKESIFELQFSSDTPDYIVNEMYNSTGGRNSYNHLSSLEFGKYNTFIDRNSDRRFNDALFGSTSSTIIPIKKYVAYRKESSASNVTVGDYVANANTQNWIFYRLSDVYLMKAEALVERNGNNDLQEAIDLVSKSYDRANPSKGTGSLQLSNYNSQTAMRNLVLDERQREFLFEGKRYFDLLRRARREGSPQTIVANYLMRKYSTQDQATVQSRLATINALYMPINKDELKLNQLLVQNPFYVTSSGIEKN